MGLVNVSRKGRYQLQATETVISPTRPLCFSYGEEFGAKRLVLVQRLNSAGVSVVLSGQLLAMLISDAGGGLWAAGFPEAVPLVRKASTFPAVPEDTSLCLIDQSCHP